MSRTKQVDTSAVEKTVQDNKRLFRSLDSERRKEKIQDAIRMIEFHRAGTDAIEERRNRVYENALTIMGAIVAAFAIVFSLNNTVASSRFVIVLISFLCAQFFVQLMIVVWYYIQSAKKYPFNNTEIIDAKYSNQWKWFYHGHEDVNSMPLTTLSFWEKNEEKTSEKYLSGLEKTINTHLSEKEEDEYVSAITQMYLLMVHNAYKNRFYLELINIQKYGGIFSVLILLVAATISCFCNG